MQEILKAIKAHIAQLRAEYSEQLNALYAQRKVYQETITGLISFDPVQHLLGGNDPMVIAQTAQSLQDFENVHECLELAIDTLETTSHGTDHLLKEEISRATGLFGACMRGKAAIMEAHAKGMPIPTNERDTFSANFSALSDVFDSINKVISRNDLTLPLLKEIVTISSPKSIKDLI